MTQGRIDWDAEVRLPVRGRSPQARHAGATGAQFAAKHRGQLAKAYLDLLAIAGPRGMSDFEAADALGRLVSSICSTRNGLKLLIVPSGSFEETRYGTKRARYVLAKDER